MLTIEFSFLAGRYHATGWNRHVNEADVAWPPDPWRLCRALAAVWFRKARFTSPLRGEDLVELLTLLAGEDPGYHLPGAVHFHTRHYMPVRDGKKDKAKLVFDAFVRVDRLQPLVIHWPHLTLSAKQKRNLDILLRDLGYLGRAESWVSARRVTLWQGTCNCVPHRWSAAIEPAPGSDRVTLLAPRLPVDYEEGKKHLLNTPGRSGMKRKGRPLLPDDWLGALIQDTCELQKDGWSMPLLARPVPYQRTKDAVRFMALAPGSSPAPRPVTVRRFALYGKPQPRITEALRVGEQVRAAAMGYAKILFQGQIPERLCGHGKRKGGNHGHAFFLPEDADADGFIDHVLVFIPTGFDHRTRRVIAGLSTVRTRAGGSWDLILEGLGRRCHFHPGGSRLLESSTRWESVTPYLHPWHRKKRFGIEDQVRKECRLRGLPEPVGIRSLDHKRPRPVAFHRFCSKRGLIQPDRRGCFLRIDFAEPVQGPLCLGFACHFGLGLFQPMINGDAVPADKSGGTEPGRHSERAST